MNAETFNKKFDALIDKERSIRDAKRNDYTGSHSPFFAFERAGDSMNVSAGLAMLGRMIEKATRLQVLLQGTKSQVKDETIIDTAVDISIISKLIAIWWEDQTTLDHVTPKQHNADS